MLHGRDAISTYDPHGQAKCRNIHMPKEDIAEKPSRGPRNLSRNRSFWTVNQHRPSALKTTITKETQKDKDRHRETQIDTARHRETQQQSSNNKRQQTMPT